MSFGLRRQLLLIGLLTLLLPWASTLYIRETESALRSAQANFLQDLARGLAPAISRALPQASPDPLDELIYLHRLGATPVLDGFSDDWRLNARLQPAVVAPELLSVLAGDDDGTVWLFARAAHAPSQLPRIEVSCLADNGELQRASLQPEAPGALNSTSDKLALNDRLRGFWQPVANGSLWELRIPRDSCRQRLGVLLAVGAQEARTYRGSMPGAIISQSPALNDVLQQNTLPGIEAYVVDRSGWHVSSISGSRAVTAEATQPAGTMARLYRRLLGSDQAGQTLAPDAVMTRLAAVTDALAGQPAQARVAIASALDEPARPVALAAQPLRQGNDVVAALVLRQDSAAILTLANPSLVRLTNTIVITTAVVVAMLLAFATWLSWRVRRLAKATIRALDSRGQLATSLPGRQAVDEIGALTRGFESLLGRVSEQQSWLRSMADKLSHELRTPLAVVQSSLDNLDFSELDPQQRALSQRASDGVRRLRAILNSMSSVNRAEQAARTAMHEQIDLSVLLNQLVTAYQSTFTDHQWHAPIADNAKVWGSADLIVQMLDKLVENAVGFAPPKSTVTLTLELESSHVIMTVHNEGPPLPAGKSANLFDGFVSHRNTATEHTHLGFGLYIARLIVEAHEGTITASNWRTNTASGVRVDVRLPRSTTHIASTAN
ncbi:MAG: ATP-binding protein [Pseudomonadota bacterium]